MNFQILFHRFDEFLAHRDAAGGVPSSRSFLFANRHYTRCKIDVVHLGTKHFRAAASGVRDEDEHGVNPFVLGIRLYVLQEIVDFVRLKIESSPFCPATSHDLVVGHERWLFIVLGVDQASVRESPRQKFKANAPVPNSAKAHDFLFASGGRNAFFGPSIHVFLEVRKSKSLKGEGFGQGFDPVPKMLANAFQGGFFEFAGVDSRVFVA